MALKISFLDKNLVVPADREWELSLWEPGKPCDILLFRPQELKHLSEEFLADVTRVVICGEQEAFPELLSEGLADDLISFPIRKVDIFRLLLSHEQVQALRSIENSSKSLPLLIQQLEKDLALAEKVQRRFIREKFPPIAGISIKSKYLSGLKAGGDYFDVQEIEGTPLAMILMGDASSYSVSTALISSLLENSAAWARQDLEKPEGVLAKLLEGPYSKMKEKDYLHCFFGILNRKTLQLRYVINGEVRFGYGVPGGQVNWADFKTLSLKKEMACGPPQEVLLEPGQRVVLASNGWEHSLVEEGRGVLTPLFRSEGDPTRLINDLLYRLRRKVGEDDEANAEGEEDLPLPPEDCSLLMLDVGRNVLRLTTQRE